MLYIYTTEITNRFEYVVDFIFKTVLGIDYQLTTNYEACLFYNNPFINYSSKSFGLGLCIPQSGFLSEQGIHKTSPDVGIWNTLPTLFPAKNYDIPFDIFAATFYLITRYEEYESNEFDQFGRFKHEASIAFKNDFLDRPLVDEWILQLKSILISKFPNLQIKERKFKSFSTIDVDHVYRYLGRSKMMMFCLFFKLILTKKTSEAKRLFRVLIYKENDPYNQFSYLERIHKNSLNKYLLFIHNGRLGKYDRKTIYPLYRFYKYLHQLNHSSIIGIHPSFKAAFQIDKIRNEKKSLEKRLHHPVTYSRHHYLRIRMPETYQILNKLGISHDFSMGYAGMYGFRASTCHPFQFYDLTNEKQTKLQIHSNIFMDGTARFYLKLSPDKALKVGSQLIEKCRNVDGEFVMLWHNNSINDMYEWKGWKKVFEKLLEVASNPSSIQRK